MHDEDEAGQAPSMARKHVETERKYEGTALPSSLDSVPGVATAQWVDQQDLDAVYYDSPDLRLLRRRITLRRRTGGDDAGWHLKLPLADDARAEIQLPLAAGSKRRVPAELTARVAAFTRDATLLPVAHLRTHRARRLLQDEEGATLAEVTEDRVAAQLLDPGQASSGTSTEISGWTEFEVELADGTPKLLDRIDTAFTEAGLARSAWPSKLARAVGTTAGPADGEQGPADRKLGPADGQLTAARAEQPGTAGAVVMTAYRALVGELLTLDAAVRRGEADSVHRMRVTARRLRSLLKAHHRLFDRRRSDPLAAEL